jgi:hypothetical protein
MNSDKILKQNDGIYFSLVTRSIHFDRVDISDVTDEDEKVRLLNDENSRLKEVIKNNKPPPQVKVKKEVVQAAPSAKKKEDKGDEEEEDNYVEKKKSFSIINNMEGIKTLFFSGEMEEFKTTIKNIDFKYFTANYKYNSDKDGSPEFSAKNSIKGFCKNFDKTAKYFMICFRCYKVGDNYEYESLWIVNTNDELTDVIGDFVNDFDFVPVNTEQLDTFLSNIEKKNTEETPFVEDNRTLIDEVYIH